MPVPEPATTSLFHFPTQAAHGGPSLRYITEGIALAISDLTGHSEGRAGNDAGQECIHVRALTAWRLVQTDVVCNLDLCQTAVCYIINRTRISSPSNASDSAPDHRWKSSVATEAYNLYRRSSHVRTDVNDF